MWDLKLRGFRHGCVAATLPMLILTPVLMMLPGSAGRADCPRGKVCVPVPEPPSSDATSEPDPTQSEEPATRDRRAKAKFEWSLAPRFGRWSGGLAYNPRNDAYNQHYVYPSGWAVDFDACASEGADSPIASYVWRIRGAERKTDQFRPPVETTQECGFNRFVDASDLPPIPRHCRDDPDPARCPELGPEELDGSEEPHPPIFPKQGRYEVTLTVRTEDGDSDSMTQDVVVKDWLIVAVGDSNAAGQGNPDVPAEWDLTLWDPDDPIWQEPDCNRSRTSGPALAAQALEKRDPHSAVTFISFACSGATLAQISEQVDKVRTLLCGAGEGCRNDARRVDALFVSAGINDLAFSDIIRACITPDTNSTVCDRHYAASANRNIFALHEEFAGAIELVNPSEVYITEYPSEEVFHDSQGGAGGCGVFLAISKREAHWLSEVGKRLNDEVRAAAKAHRWNYVGGIAEDFRGHGYCAEDTWFVEMNETLIDQLDYKGVIHPNRSGHEVTARHLVRAFDTPKPDRSLTKRVTVDIEQVRVRDKPAAQVGQAVGDLEIRVSTSNDRDPRHIQSGTRSIPVDEWVALTQDQFTHTWDVAAVDEVRVHVRTTLPAVLEPVDSTDINRKILDVDRGQIAPRRRLSLNETFGRAENYGEGRHEETSTQNGGSLTVRYRIDVEALPPAGGGNGSRQYVTYEPNVDRPGSDYRNFDLAAAEPERCATACDGDGRCEAYTYVKPGYQGQKARCWLKDSVPRARSGECCVSGTK